MNLYVGTSGFSYNEWKGSFYPKEISNEQMLRFYGERFRSVEINYTFSRMPNAPLLEGWAEKVPAEFKFVLKAPKQITHILRLKNTHKVLSLLLEVSSALKDRLGPLLFQLPPYLKKDTPLLREFIALLPPHRPSAFEFRHESWFDGDVFALLRQHGSALCIAEAEDGIEVPFVSTANWGYIRLRRADYGDVELRDWVKKVYDQNWRDAFVFFRHEDEGKGPKLAKRFLELAG